MTLGGDPTGDTDGTVSPVVFALDQFSVGVDHLVKVVEDGGLDELDTVRFVGFMQGLERARNRLPLADHRIIADAERRDLPGGGGTAGPGGRRRGRGTDRHDR